MSLDSFVTYVLDLYIPGARASHARSPDVTKWNPGITRGPEHPRIPLRYIRATIQRVVLTRIPARQDSIDLPWSIDPISEAVRFGRLRTDGLRRA